MACPFAGGGGTVCDLFTTLPVFQGTQHRMVERRMNGEFERIRKESAVV
jgi:hypothetical protein